MPRRPQRRVAIPRRMTLRGRRWTVRVAERVPKSDDGQPGASEEALCDRTRRTIWIRKRMRRERREERLVHEALHAIWPIGIVTMDEEEQLVSALAPRLHAAIVAGALSATTEGVG